MAIKTEKVSESTIEWLSEAEYTSLIEDIEALEESEALKVTLDTPDNSFPLALRKALSRGHSNVKVNIKDVNNNDTTWAIKRI